MSFFKNLHSFSQTKQVINVSIEIPNVGGSSYLQLSKLDALLFSVLSQQKLEENIQIH